MTQLKSGATERYALIIRGHELFAWVVTRTDPEDKPLQRQTKKLCHQHEDKQDKTIDFFSEVQTLDAIRPHADQIIAQCRQLKRLGA